MNEHLRKKAALVGLFLVVTLVLFAQRHLRPLQAADNAAAPVRRVNVPYTSAADDSLPVPERAIFWFGEVGPTSANYTDVRVIYNDDHLFVTLHIFDRLLFYKQNPSAVEMVDWDAATLYLNMDGNTGSVPGTAAHKFVAQFNFNESRDAYQAAYQGNGVGWTTSATSFMTTDGWQGAGLNDNTEDRGWNVTFQIPFTSLGLTGKPADETVWGMAVAVHDRDDAGGAFIADKEWPENLNTTQPATWGQIHFGLPGYEVPPATPGDVVTIRHGENGIVVSDGQVGGDSTCANAIWPNFWPEWGSLNYASGEPQKRMNVQNQWNLGDWPCFSKYYATFPLGTIPAGKVILSATLTLYQFGNSNQDGSYNPPPEPSLIQIMTVAEDWNEGTLTWNNGPQAVENVSRAWVDPLPAGPPWPNVPRQWDVSGAVAEAYETGEPLRLAVYSADNALHSGKYFRSSDADLGVRPFLQIAWGYDKGFTAEVTPGIQSLSPGDSADFTVNVQPTDGSVTSVMVEVGDPYADLTLSATSQTVSVPGQHVFMVTDSHDSTFTTGMWYTLPITVTGGTAVQTTHVQFLLNGTQIYLPLVQKN